jgi:serine/threonine protein phosphatase 1
VSVPESKAARVIAIGDVHGCAAALTAITEAIGPKKTDTIVTLGDYINRGPDSRSVLKQLLALRRHCRLVPLLGNHEIMLLKSRDNPQQFARFLASGGTATLDSYGAGRHLELIPGDHMAFIRQCAYYHETATHFFVHGNYEPAVPLAKQDKQLMLWLSLRDKVPKAHMSGKIAVVGHTPQADGEILDLGYLKCLDTGCCRGGWLTAMDVVTGKLWQADADGKLRKG